MASQPTIHDVFESRTGTWQYVVADPATSSAAIIDPVLDFDPSNQALTTGSADSLLSLVKDKGYKVDMILETHVHADHVTAGSYLQSRLSQLQGYKPPIGIGKRIGGIQDLFSKKYGVAADEVKGVFERLFDDDEVFEIGNLKARAIHLPGHTPDHLGYMIGGDYATTSEPIPATPRAMLTVSQTMSFAATPSSTQTLAPPGVTSPVVTRATCTSQGGSSLACPAM
jgi:glyoxylase-like metal-dependent hydrolase (beta-lactamase superfamily II)